MKAAYFILNPFDNDSRARLEVETIRSMGFEVDIIATVGADSSEYLGCRIYRIAQPKWPSRKRRFVHYNLAAADMAARLRADICHAVDLDTLYAASRAASKSGAKLIYEARELYTELEALRGRPMIKLIWSTLERRLIKKADVVFTINKSIAGELVSRYGIDPPAVIRNVAPLTGSLRPVNLRSEFDIPANHKIIIYQGVLRRGQGLPYLVGLLKRIENTTLILLGDGPLRDELGKLAGETGLHGRVKFAGMIPPDRLLHYTAGGDLGALLMEDVALNNRLALPQKLFQYISAGVPQVVSPMPEISAQVESGKTGMIISMKDPEADSSKITRYIRDEEWTRLARENCRASAAVNNWETESRLLKEIYARLGRM